MTKGSKWRGTFNWWFEYPPSEVKTLKPEDLGEYTSSYNKWFAYLKENNWERKEGKWCSPCGTYKFDKIKEAYDCQAYYFDKIKK